MIISNRERLSEARTIEVVVTCRESGRTVDQHFAYGRTDAEHLREQLEDTWGERYLVSFLYQLEAV